MNRLEFKGNAPYRKYRKGNVVIFQGEVPRYGFIVSSGSLKVYSIDNDGNERVVGIYSKGDVLATDWVIGINSAAMFYHETLEDSVLVPFSKEEFLNSKHLIDYTNRFLAMENPSSLIRNLALQQPNATNKILYFFFYLAIRHGQEKAANLFSLGLPLTHQFIADNLGITRETVATEISKFKKGNVVMYRKKHYIVDKALLIKTVGKEITSNYVD